MKHLILITTFLTSISLTFAQPQKPHKEKIEAYKIAFFTKQMKLTPEESQAFWPLYNQYEDEKETMQRELKREGQQFEFMSDKEAEAFVLKNFEMQEKQLALKRKYFEKFKAILPIRKVVKIYQAEDAFKEQLIREIQKRRMENRGNRRNN